MGKNRPNTDPRGHSLRIYKDIYTSAAFKSLSPVDVMVYLALLADLKQYNNGDLSLTLTRAKQCGIRHHITLARSLRALCAVGLVALTRKGGCAKGGQRLPNLYRVTDRECYAIPGKHLEAMNATHDWNRVITVDHGKQLIQSAEDDVKKETIKLKTLGHAVTTIRSRRDVIKPNIRTHGDAWNDEPGHVVTMAENPADSMPARVTGTFSPPPENQGHRTPAVPPLYVATPTGESALSVTVMPTATTPAATAANTDDDSRGQIERVHDHELDPANFDTDTGEFVAAPVAPARKQKRAADRRVNTALTATGQFQGRDDMTAEI